MLKLENISIELKNINKELENYQLLELIKKIDQEVKEQTSIKKPSDKKRLNTIKKYLEANKDTRPTLSAWTPFNNNQVAFTNSYSLFILNEKTLPFKVAFSNIPEEEKEKFIKENNIDKNDIINNVYPNLKHVIPEEMDQKDTYKLDINSFIAWYKCQDKKDMKNNKILYNLGDDLNPYTVNPILLKELIDILQLQGVVCVEFYGDLKPCIIRNNGEIGLLLPVKKY